MENHKLVKQWTPVPGAIGLYTRTPQPEGAASELSQADRQRIDDILREFTTKVNGLAETLTKK